MRHIACIVMGVVLNHASFAYGAETIAYSYDVQGRLIKVVHSGSANTGVQSLYSHDAADNRASVATTGAATALTQEAADKRGAISDGEDVIDP